MQNIIFIADFFSNEIRGGAELHSEEIIKCLSERGYEVSKLKSQNVSSELLDSMKGSIFVVSNFMMLNESAKKSLIDNHEYLILENDHKYVKSNNPTLYPNMVIPEQELQNIDFFKNAKAVFCQSKMHAETIQKNLLIDNIVNLSCNIWSDEDIASLRSNLYKQKTRKFGVMESSNRNKGTLQTVEYCRNNNIEFDLIPPCSQKEFYNELAKTETLVFFPQWMETYCRVAVEARILGCKMITNKVIGCTSESYFKLKDEELLKEIEKRKTWVINAFVSIFDGHPIEGLEPIKHLVLPKVSVITTIFKAGEYIEGFLQSFLNQTIAKQCELIIVDANSPDDEMEVINEYRKLFDNINYVRLTEQLKPMECFNIATQQYADGEYIACVLVDDRMAPDHLETLAKHLKLDSTVDLVYGDCLQTTKPNETVLENSSKGKLYEHSRNDFSPENMIKCLPGPMPMYRKSMHDKHGMWNPKLKHAGDWELFLRCVRGGSKFKKVHKVVGLYYYNPKGLSSNNSDMELVKRRHKEEKEVFFEYKDVIGEKNFNTFKDYFDNLYNEEENNN